MPDDKRSGVGGQSLRRRLADEEHQARALTAMVVRVREALAVARWGMPDVYYARTIHCLRLAGLDVGTKYDTAHFVERVEFMGAMAGRALQAKDLAECLPALGIPSDLSLIFDGVRVGAKQFSRHESLLLLGVAFEVAASSIFQRAGPRIQVRMLGAPSSGQRHDGVGQKDCVMEALAEHPARLSREGLSARLAVIGADGASAKG